MGVIRFILACAVVLCHSSLLFSYTPVTGALAVQCFYIISGFYMALVLSEKYTGPNATYLFYTNRALKIYPVYWVNLILLVAWSALVYRLHYPGTITVYGQHWPLKTLTLVYFVLSNIIILGLDGFYFLGVNKHGSLFFTADFQGQSTPVYNFTFNIMGWTVGVELLFYLIAPFIVRRRLFYIVLIVIGSLALRIVMAAHGLDGRPWSDVFFPNQLMLFFGGVLSYRLYKFVSGRSVGKGIHVLAYTILLSVVLLYYEFFQESYIKQGILFALMALCMPFAFILTQKSPIDRLLGNISYPIYISQALILRVLAVKSFPKPLGEGITAVLILVVFSLLLERFLTKPIEKYRQLRISRKAKDISGRAKPTPEVLQLNFEQVNN